MNSVNFYSNFYTVTHIYDSVDQAANNCKTFNASDLFKCVSSVFF